MFKVTIALGQMCKDVYLDSRKTLPVIVNPPFPLSDQR